MIKIVASHNTVKYICEVYDKVYNKDSPMKEVIDLYGKDEIYDVYYGDCIVGVYGVSYDDDYEDYELTYVSFTDKFKITYTVLEYMKDNLWNDGKKYTTYTEVNSVSRYLLKSGWTLVDKNRLEYKAGD